MVNLGPSPDLIYPVPGNHEITYLKNVVKNPNIVAGDYTWFYDLEDATDFERHVLYHYPMYGDKLIIGKFSGIGGNVKFIMNGINLTKDAISMYPFYIFGHGWEKYVPSAFDFDFRGDTVIHNDVWIGNEVMIMPGVEIGNGAIIFTGSVVHDNVPPYAVVCGNPARVIRMRFSEETIKLLQRMKWWDWPIEKINQNIDILSTGDMYALNQLMARMAMIDPSFEEKINTNGRSSTNLKKVSREPLSLVPVPPHMRSFDNPVPDEEEIKAVYAEAQKQSEAFLSENAKIDSTKSKSSPECSKSERRGPKSPIMKSSEEKSVSSVNTETGTHTHSDARGMRSEAISQQIREKELRASSQSVGEKRNVLSAFPESLEPLKPSSQYNASILSPLIRSYNAQNRIFGDSLDCCDDHSDHLSGGDESNGADSVDNTENKGYWDFAAKE